MIVIEERLAHDAPGGTSFFISFNYNPKIINEIKCLDFRSYNENTHEWETSVCYLNIILDKLILIDDIKLVFIPYKDISHKIEHNTKQYKTKPFNHQLEAIDFGLNINNWLLLDTMGLGKSLSATYLAEERKNKDNIKHCLIVCGVNNLKFNWKKEIENHSGLSCMILGEKKLKNGKIVIGSVNDRLIQLKKGIKEFFIITNIETLRNDKIVKAINAKKSNIDMIVVDEIHCCKSTSSTQGSNLLKLKADYKLGMSGTLLLNNPLDLYVPLKWIGVEKCSLTNFKAHYCVYGGDFGNLVVGYKNLDLIKYQLSTCSLRRTKDILNLPPKIIIPEYIEMSEDQKLFYNNLEKGIVEDVDKVNIKTTSLLAMIARLRQATALPAMLSTSNISACKLDRACELVDSIIENGNKVVIFSTFKASVYELARRLNKYKLVTATGDNKDEEVSSYQDQFQNDDDTKVFIGTWQKCGTGITLTAASYMIFIDTPWTDGVFDQACDRIHRIGTKDTVFIYNLIAKDTIDERVLDIINTKGALSDYIIDDMIISDTALAQLRKYIEDLSKDISKTC